MAAKNQPAPQAYSVQIPPLPPEATSGVLKYCEAMNAVVRDLVKQLNQRATPGWTPPKK